MTNVRDLRAEQIGPDTVYAGLRIAVPPGRNIKEGGAFAEEVPRRMHQGADLGYCVEAVGAASTHAS